MKPIVKLGYLAAACILLITTFSIVGPRAVRAAVATLVQVVNTVSDPVLTQSTTKAASQLVLLVAPQYGNILPGGNPVAFVRALVPSGAGFTPYVVPAGQNLVITEMDINASNPPGGTQVVLFALTTNAEILLEVVNVANLGFQQARFSSGIVYPAASSVLVQNSGPSLAYVTLHGYLTSN